MVPQNARGKAKIKIKTRPRLGEASKTGKKRERNMHGGTEGKKRRSRWLDFWAISGKSQKAGTGLEGMRLNDAGGKSLG